GHRPTHRLAAAVSVGEVSPPEHLATLGDPGEPARPERLEEHEERRQLRLRPALRAGDHRRVVQLPPVRAQSVGVDDEPAELAIQLHRLALDVAGAVDAEVLDPRPAEMAQRPVPVVAGGGDQLTRHRPSSYSYARPA